MEILFSLEKGAGVDLLGEIRLSDGQNTISANLTYIDSWVEALEKGAKCLERDNVAHIDLIEETDPLIFEKRDNYIKLTYREMFIFPDSVEEIHSSVRRAMDKIKQTRR